MNVIKTTIVNKIFEMNLANLRNKQRQLHRALDSIPVPNRQLKVVTESQ